MPFLVKLKSLNSFSLQENRFKVILFSFGNVMLNRALDAIWAQEERSSGCADPLKCRDCAFAGPFQYLELLTLNEPPHF